MKITEVRIRKLSVEGKLRAYATVTFDNCFVVHNIKIIDGKAEVESLTFNLFLPNF